MADLLFGTRRGMALEASSACPDCERADHGVERDVAQEVLGLGIVQSSRSSLRRADASDKRPARRIAGGKALFQAFVDLVFGRRSSQQLRLALAPRDRGSKIGRAHV